jgi:2-amino-4-hydroxy-6-hydroxymethyldihydropteridine diphosphokinase
VKTVPALLLLGANLGRRAETLARAVASLRRLPGMRVTKVSRLFETAPVGPSEEPYLNQAVRIETTRTPMGLLIEAKILEAAAGRRPGKRWGARVLDADLVAYGDARIRTPWLTVPHRLAHARPFALAPLADVAPEWRLRGKSVAARLAAMNPPASVVRPYRP